MGRHGPRYTATARLDVEEGRPSRCLSGGWSAHQVIALVVERLGRNRLPSGDSAAVLEEPGLALGQGLHRMRDRVTELEQRLRAQVVDGVARLVVAPVVGSTRGTAVDRRLLYGLDALGPGEQPASRDAGVDEWAVVGPAIECRWLGGQTLLAEVVVVQGLDLCGTRWSGGL